MDQNEFYRQATLSICGSLKIEEALLSLLAFLRQTMPVDRIFLQFFEPALKSFRTVAIISPKKGMTVDLPVPLSSEALQELAQFEKEFRAKKKNIAFIQDMNPYELAVNREYFAFHKTDITSIIVVPLGLDKKKMLGQGSFFFVAQGEDRFTQAHADLLSALKEPFAIALSNLLKHREASKLMNRLADDNRYLQKELHRISGDEIIGADFGLKEVMDKVSQVAAMNSPVLLLGETGVGKDVIANAIHYSSSRNKSPLVSVNCGAIPETLIDSELFGHEKGAFTGALAQKRGRFERADKGTIFLDEIGELPLQAQVRFLKVLQDNEIERVGGVKTIPLDIRIIAATNRNLEEMVNQHQFREDLWFRLNVFPIWIPPLRKRTVDIPALLQHFISQKSKEMNLPAIPQIADGAIDPLMGYHWPGNVRELENAVERSLIINPKGPLTFDHMNIDRHSSKQGENSQEEETDNMNEMISKHIRNVLERTGGKINGPDGAAEILGINPSTLRNRMKTLGIDFGRDSRG